MLITGEELMTWVAGILWPFMRIGAMLFAAPIFSMRSLPVRVRVLLSFSLAWILFPVIPEPPAVDLLSAEALLISVYQVLIGVSMGFILQLVFGAFVIAGQSVAMSMGLGFASMVDPQNGTQVPLIGQSFLIMVTLIFLALNGHLVLIQTLAESFQLLPVGFIKPSMDSLFQLVLWGGHMFVAGVLVALPIVTALLLVNLSFGVAARAAPQLNIFAVGFPVMMLVGFLLMLLTFPGITNHLVNLLDDAYVLMGDVITSGSR